jgi:hypothetical protein
VYAFFAHYTYAAGALAMVALAAACAALWRGPAAAQGRRSMLWAALLGWPFGLFSFENIPKYWQPDVVCWFGPASIEDLVFVAGCAALSWFWATLPLRGRLRHAALERDGRPGPVDWRGILLRFVLGAAPGIGVAYALGLGVHGTMVITATLWGYAVGGAMLIWLKRECWPLLVYGGGGFAASYLLVLRLLFAIWPGFTLAWRHSLQPHAWVLGLPVHEFAWALGYGAVWPLFVAWCLDTRLSAAPEPPAAPAGPARDC